MCLKTSFRGRNNPKTDINCYKVLIHLNGKILAPFTRYEYKLDEVLIDTAEENTKKDRAYVIMALGIFMHALGLKRLRALSQDLEKSRMEKFLFIRQ